MKPSETIEAHRSAIRQVVQDHHACNARIFGSVLHGEDTENSDVDILVDSTKETTLLDIAAIRLELREMLGVSVDVLTPGALPESFRARVLIPRARVLILRVRETPVVRRQGLFAHGVLQPPIDSSEGFQ